MWQIELIITSWKKTHFSSITELFHHRGLFLQTIPNTPCSFSTNMKTLPTTINHTTILSLCRFYTKVNTPNTDINFFSQATRTCRIRKSRRLSYTFIKDQQLWRIILKTLQMPQQAKTWGFSLKTHHTHHFICSWGLLSIYPMQNKHFLQTLYPMLWKDIVVFPDKGWQWFFSGSPCRHDRGHFHSQQVSADI